MIKILVTENGIFKCENNYIVTFENLTYIKIGDVWHQIGKPTHVINLDNSTKVEDIEYLMEKLKK